MLSLTKNINSSESMIALGAKLAAICLPGIVIHLHGPLGAGKTTLVRGFLQGMGHVGKVKSPTYTLVEPYELPNQSIFHFDLFRLQHPEELHEIGINEYFSHDAICLIEWPEKGGELLIKPDIICTIAFHENERVLKLSANTARGETILKKL